MGESVWVPTLDESHLQEETIHLVSPKGVSIILIKKDGQIYALRNRCAHMSCTLAGGRLDGDTLQCPCHDWKFDITTGEFIAAREIKVQTYLLQVPGWKDTDQAGGNTMKKVSMYTLSTCPWCHKTKKYFTDHNIPFKYVDYDLQSAAGAGKNRTRDEETGWSALVSLGAHRRRPGRRLEPCEIR